MHHAILRVISLRHVVLAASVLGFSSCATPRQGNPFEDPGAQTDLDRQAKADPESEYSYWNDKGGGGAMRVTIDLGEQAAYFYRGEKLVGRSRVATGRSGYSTPQGSFTILEKTAEKRSNLFGHIADAGGSVVVSDADSRRDSVPAGGSFVGASMPLWMRLTPSGVGMHAGQIPNPGRPASHGCIRMPRDMAEKLYASAPLGTPVKIVP